MCPPVSLCKGASVVKFPAHNACIFGMETPLRGRSGGHTGAAPTISRVAPCSKVAGEQFADGLNRKKVAGE